MAKLQDSMSPVLDGLSKSIGQLFAPEARSPPQKSGRTADKSPTEPFTRVERTWLAHAVGESSEASTLALAKAVDTRIEDIESHVLQLQGEVGDIRTTMEGLQGAQTKTRQLAEGTKDELRQAEGRMVKELELVSSKIENMDIKHTNEMNEMRELIDQATTRNASTSKAQVTPQDPWLQAAQDPWSQAATSKGKGKGKSLDSNDTYPKDTTDEWSGLWILGNLGYDTATDVLIDRAKEILGKLPGFSHTDLIEDIRSFGTRPGSSVLIKFKDRAEGEKWRPKLFLLEHRFPENSPELRAERNQSGTGTVYLRKQPTDTERRPLVITKRCGAELTRVEAALPDGWLFLSWHMAVVGGRY